MDNIYVNYLLTALILTFAIPGAGVVIEQFVKLLYSVTAAFLGDRLGYVEYVTRGNIIMRSIQQALASIAPVFCGALTSAGIYYYLTVYGAALAVWQTVLLWYVFISIILHMTMSRQDFKGLYRGIPVVYLIVFAIVYICKFTLF